MFALTYKQILNIFINIDEYIFMYHKYIKELSDLFKNLCFIFSVL